jgi:hypothetical protein
MSEVKRCKQCGLLKDVEEFRPYTYSKKNETGGRFSTCRSCEAINSKYTKLKATGEDSPELMQLEKLFGLLESQGLHTPLSRLQSTEQPKTTVELAVDKLMKFYGDTFGPVAKPVVVLPTDTKVDTPKELQQWLTETSDDWVQKGLSPEFLQETIYESLKAKYRPQIGFDQEKFIPIYDDTYKDVLNEILRRFDDYEEEAAGEMISDD